MPSTKTIRKTFDDGHYAVITTEQTDIQRICLYDQHGNEEEQFLAHTDEHAWRATQIWNKQFNGSSECPYECVLQRNVRWPWMRSVVKRLLSLTDSQSVVSETPPVTREVLRIERNVMLALVALVTACFFSLGWKIDQHRYAHNRSVISVLRESAETFDDFYAKTKTAGIPNRHTSRFLASSNAFGVNQRIVSRNSLRNRHQEN